MDEAPPAVQDETIVAMGLIVIGVVRIGPRSYVAAGAVVTKDVRPVTVVIGTSIHTGRTTSVPDAQQNRSGALDSGSVVLPAPAGWSWSRTALAPASGVLDVFALRSHDAE